MTSAIVVECACGSQGDARALAAMLVEARLAACVQVAPVESHYRWDGEVRCDAEWLLRIKTAADQFDAVAGAIRAAHAYDVPELIALPVAAGSADYLDWVRAQTR